MKLHVTGLNHRTAPVEIRARIAFNAASLPQALLTLRNSTGFHESMILSTCNRVEIVIAADENADANHGVLGFLHDSQLGHRGDLSSHLYHYEDREAIRHLFRVASSLDSMVLGEPQILGQLKEAWSVAKEHAALAQYLHPLLPPPSTLPK